MRGSKAAASVLDAEIVYEQLLADHASARARLAAQVGSEVRNVMPVVLAPVPAATLQERVPGLVESARLRAEAARAHADGFIVELRDWAGRTGYEAHAGERGVKLSGGQRQRIALARVLVDRATEMVSPTLAPTWNLPV